MSASVPQTYANRYTIRSLIGEGAFSRTYLATDMTLQRTVAVKVLRREYVDLEAFAARFDREARAAARVSHPNVVTVFDFGREGNIPFIVMQYVDGPSLREYVREAGPLTVEEAVNFTRQILDGLSAIHDQQIVHRDVKPQNVLLDDGLTAKLTDFGVAFMPVDHGLTETGATVGTAAYMAPEQASGETVGPAADLYAVGVLLYELVAGQLPFRGDNPVQVMYRHVSEMPAPPRSLNQYVPLPVEAVILRALSKSPADRYPDARSMRDALIGRTETGAGAAAAATIHTGAVSRELEQDAEEHEPTGDLPPPPPRRRQAAGSGGFGRWLSQVALALALGLIVVLIAIVLVNALDSGGGGENPANPTATSENPGGVPVVEPTATEVPPTETPTPIPPTATETATVSPPTPTQTATTEPTPAPTATPPPPTPTVTATPAPPTATQAPPTATQVAPTATPNPVGGEFNTPFPASALPGRWTRGPSVRFGRDEFVAGGAYRRDDGRLYGRPAAHLYSQQTEYSTTTVAFDLQGEEPSSYIGIVVTGLDDEVDPHVPCRLLLNGEVVWSGPSPFENADDDLDEDDDWTTIGWQVGNLNWLQSGENTMTFEILADEGEFGLPPWLLLTGATIYYG